MALKVIGRINIKTVGKTRVHELKTDSAAFSATLAGEKTFEIRKNDRCFMIGDELLLRETRHSSFDMDIGTPLLYTGRAISLEVKYILQGPAYGLGEGFCVMSVDAGNVDSCS